MFDTDLVTLLYIMPADKHQYSVKSGKKYAILKKLLKNNLKSNSLIGEWGLCVHAKVNKGQGMEIY